MIPDTVSHFFKAAPKAKGRIDRMAYLVGDVLGFSIGFARDVAILPTAMVALLLEKTMERLNIDFNPKPGQAKKGKIAIVLLHGSGFCQAQWHLARLFLRGEKFGSVYSLNYGEGVSFNHRDSSIEDYAGGEKLRNLMAKIKEETKQNRVIIIGHSMGSMVGECFAQRYAKGLGIEVPHLLSISYPWQGSLTIDLLGLKARRFQEMSHASGAPEHLAFRKNLVEKAKKDERDGKRLQWNIWCKHDRAVPGRSGCLTEAANRQYEIFGIGHYTPMVSLRVLRRVRAWVSQMYEFENSPL